MGICSHPAGKRMAGAWSLSCTSWQDLRQMLHVLAQVRHTRLTNKVSETLREVTCALRYITAS